MTDNNLARPLEGVVEEAQKHRTELRDSLLPIAKTSDKHIAALIDLATAQAARIAGLARAIDEGGDDPDLISKIIIDHFADRARANAAETALAAERAKVAQLVEALRITRDRLSSVLHSEFDGVWSEQDFLDEVKEADAALSEAEGRDE